MHGPQQQQQLSGRPFEDARRQLNTFIGLCQIVSGLLRFFLCWPGSGGARSVTYQTFMGWLFVPLFAAYSSQNSDVMGLMVFWKVSFYAALAHAVCGLVRRAGGRVVHSRYIGDSILPGSPGIVKGVCEPLLVIALGYFTRCYDPALGAYWMLSGCALAVSVQYSLAADRAAVRGIRDARFYQEYLMSLTRED